MNFTAEWDYESEYDPNQIFKSVYNTVLHSLFVFQRFYSNHGSDNIVIFKITAIAGRKFEQDFATFWW